MFRRTILLIAILSVAGCKTTPKPGDADVEALDAALERGAAFLVTKQGLDGAWRSESYGAFKDGYSLTPLVLGALLFAPDVEGRRRAYRSGVDFMATMVDGEALRAGFEAPGYPVYSASLGAAVFSVPRNHVRHPKVRAVLIQELRRRQRPTGGWGYTSSGRAAANLSSTLYALGGLRLAGVGADDPAVVRARGFVERCQNVPGDGGFFHSPDLPDSNKAGATGPHSFRSYGSMTADGARALRRAGVPADHPRVIAAQRWLEVHFDPKKNPGAFPPGQEVRRESAWFYWIWSAAHALLQMGSSGWERPLIREVLRRQRPDGAWANGYTEMREDDPLLATSFAMAALSVARYRLTGEWLASP
jgi:hypothetical protein